MTPTHFLMFKLPYCTHYLASAIFTLCFCKHTYNLKHQSTARTWSMKIEKEKKKKEKGILTE